VTFVSDRATRTAHCSFVKVKIVAMDETVLEVEGLSAQNRAEGKFQGV